MESTEKIFIAINTQKLNTQQTNLQLLCDSLKEANEVITELIGIKLNEEIAQNIVNNGFEHFIDEQVKIEELKLKGLNLAKLTISNNCSDLRNALKSDLDEAFKSTSNFIKQDCLKYIGFHKNGNPTILETAQKEIAEACSVYADTDQKIKLFNKHKQAVKVLNELKALGSSTFGHQYSDLNFYSQFFVFDRENNILQSELNYNLLG